MIVDANGGGPVAAPAPVAPPATGGHAVRSRPDPARPRRRPDRAEEEVAGAAPIAAGSSAAPESNDPAGPADEASDELDAALAVLADDPDVVSRKAALHTLAAADRDPARAAAVNALLDRTLLNALEETAATADHLAAMMTWADDAAAYRQIGETTLLASGPFAVREVARRAATSPDPEAGRALAPLLADPTAAREVRAILLEVGPGAAAAVRPLRDDPDPAVSAAAASLLERLEADAG